MRENETLCAELSGCTEKFNRIFKKKKIEINR